MPTPAPSDQARKAMKSAFNQLQATITPGHARNFSSTTLEHVRTELLKIENELAARQLLRNTRRLAPLLQGLEHYAKVMDVLCNGTPFLPWVWAPITLILRIASEHLEAFEHIIKGYRRIAECLGRFAVLDNAFKHVHGFQQTLAVFYADILEFHGHAYQFVHRSGWKLLFVTSWHRFQRRFDHIFDNLKKHEELIDKEANAHNIAEAQQMRLDVRAWQEKCAEQLERTDRDQSIKQHDSIISWLKVDGSDQLNIFQALFEESTKYPGTCEWVIQHKSVRSFLQRKLEVPVLWIQGAAGTGKSVLSSNIMNYMDHSGWLVLSHFCNYAYPSSTKYDCILRSLLAQLIRKDGDLAAHVYEDYVLGKKTPNIPILERLLHFLLSSISKQSQQTAYIWVILDGLDECDSVTQNKVLSLITHATSRAPSSSEVICKALISCRFSASASTKLRRTQAISLAEEKEQMSKSIQLYAAQRLNAIYSKFQQLSLSEDDIKGIEDTITKKADGMFLYARLVLDYLSSNIFFHGYEIKDSVHELPKELSEFYSKIVTQILVHLNRRSVDRLKCALGWIAFSKRPLKKMEFLSANAFSSNEEDVKHVAPQYMLDICTALIEERPDSRLGFIHVSVKEFLQSESSNLVLIERDCLLQHGIATIRCLLAGIEAFLKAVPQHHEQVLLEVIKGLHSFHIYSKEYWTDYLLSLVKPYEEEDSTYNPLFSRALEFATKLDQHRNGGSEPTTYVDDRISNLPDPLLRRVLNECLEARSEGDLKLKLQQVEAKGKEVANTGILAIPSPSEGVSLLLERYQATLQYLLRQTDFPGVTAAEFNSFKRQSRASAFTCRVKGCPQATEGFESQTKCHEHELLHVRRPECTYAGCQYPPTKAADGKDGGTSPFISLQEFEERSARKQKNAYTSRSEVPKLDRTTTDIYNDELYSPSWTIKSTSPAAQSQLVMSPSNATNELMHKAIPFVAPEANQEQAGPLNVHQQLGPAQFQEMFIVSILFRNTLLPG
ncbi:NACHT domain-containing protein [Apiospora arundinis]